MQSLCCSRVAASKLFNQVHDKQQIFFIHLQIFFINLQLCPAVVSGSETSILFSPEYRKINGKMRKSLMQRNSDYEYEFRWRQMVQPHGFGFACGYQHSLPKLYKHGNQGPGTSQHVPRPLIRVFLYFVTSKSSSPQCTLVTSVYYCERFY